MKMRSMFPWIASAVVAVAVSYSVMPGRRVRALASCMGCNKGLVIPTLELFDIATRRTTLVVPDTQPLKSGSVD